MRRFEVTHTLEKKASRMKSNTPSVRGAERVRRQPMFEK